MNTAASSDKRTETALQRTDYAEDRTVQATERTFAGWLRTAFGAIGVGLAFEVLFGKLEPPWLARCIASLFILLGAAVTVAAERRASRTFARLSTHAVDSPSIPSIRWISWTVVAGALALVAGLWLLHDQALGTT